MEEGRREKKTGKESISILINRTTHHQRSSWKLLSISCDIGRCYVIKKHSSNPILGPGQEGPLTWDLTGRGLPSSSLSCALWDKESTDPKGLVYSGPASLYSAYPESSHAHRGRSLDVDAQLGVHTRVARSPCTMGQGMGTEDKRDHELRAKLSPYRSPRYPRILSSNLDFQVINKEYLSR